MNLTIRNKTKFDLKSTETALSDRKILSKSFLYTHLCVMF